MSAYREPGREVDTTEIERAKIHEAEETKRASIKEREATRRERIKAVDTGGYIITRLGFACVAIGAIIGVYYTAAGYFESRQTGCHDESFRKNTNGNPRCPNNEQRMTETPEFWVCSCPRHEAKPAGSQ
jgi:hypothetical protein